MSGTFYDPRAQRAVAGAEAERARAEAEATRAQTAIALERERRLLDRQHAQDERQHRDERARTKAAARKERREQSRRDRAARRAAARRGAGALAAAVAERAPVIVGAVAMGAPIAIAWRGQLEFATDVMHLGFMAPALPIALEGGVWYLAFLVHRAIMAKLPIGRYRAATWMLAGIAAGMNLWHGIHANGDDGLQVGVILALASLLGIALWELTASLTQQTTTRRSAAEIRRAAWRRLRYPRLSWSAASIRASRGESCSIEEAWTAAWIDRFGVGPSSSRRDRKLARSIVSYEKKADRAAAKDGRLVIVDGSIVRPGASTAQQSAEGEEAMARLKAFSAQRQDVARSIAFPSIDRPPVQADRLASIEAASIDRVPARPRKASSSASIEAPRSSGPDSITAPRPSIDGSIESRSIEASIESESLLDPIDPEYPSAPRRSIEAHRTALRAAIGAGLIDPQEATAEGIRKILRCAPKTAQTLRDEIRMEVSA
ncbi:DUF2637 domain-containing protein [Streptosporangium sp. NPDC023615]|uniref:DUF2637 domain-containing protein n=1 Tax=Streptosporangium sp. NPDC023615 TaxID=3154794 RepID=UPI0034365CEC